MKKKDPNPNILYMDADPVTESVCKEHGINIWGPSFDLFNYLGNKVEILKLLKESEIPFIPNICSKIDDYQHFLQITSKFSTSKVVVQDQIGYCGTGTIFI
jgi:pyruvate carboxylase